MTGQEDGISRRSRDPHAVAARLRRNRQDELDNATIYAAMAAVEPRPELAQVYRR